ncbi:hypothetical protein NKG94_34700 [Micromonospora sp. M12]
MRASLMTTLKPCLADRPDDAFLLTAPNGGPIHYSNFLQRRWNPALDAAGRCAEHPPPNRGEPRPDGGPVRPGAGTTAAPTIGASRAVRSRPPGGHAAVTTSAPSRA